MFITPEQEFDFKPLGDGMVRLQKELVYLHKDTPITVPQGFVFDLASYPRVVRALFDRLGDSMRPAAVHDYLYKEQPKGVTKLRADRIFRDALKHEGASFFERWASWAGVVVGGWPSWLEYKAINDKVK